MSKQKQKDNHIVSSQALVQPPPQTSLYDFSSLTLIPKNVREAARRLRAGGLESTFQRTYAADDKPIVNFLKALNELPEPMALTRLAGLLKGCPIILGHPWVWDVFENLFYKWAVDDDLHKYIVDWQIELMKAWVQGMTLGLDVSIERTPSRRAGRPIELFPHILERDGWLMSHAATVDHRDAIRFLDLYEDLHYRLKSCNEWSWKEIAQQFRQNPDQTVRMVSSDVEKRFEDFKKEWFLTSNIISESQLQQIVRGSLNQTHKKQPLRTDLVCELIATLRGIQDGNERTLTASLVHKTVATLRKHFGKDWIKSCRPYRPYAAEWLEKHPSVPVRQIAPGRYIYGSVKKKPHLPKRKRRTKSK